MNPKDMSQRPSIHTDLPQQIPGDRSVTAWVLGRKTQRVRTVFRVTSSVTYHDKGCVISNITKAIDFTFEENCIHMTCELHLNMAILQTTSLYKQEVTERSQGG